MSFIDLGLIVFVVIFIFIFYRIGFWVLLKSFIIFIVSIFLSSILLNPLLSTLASFGVKEELYVPILSFTFLVIIIWGFLLSLLMLLFPKNYSNLPDYASALLSGIFAVCVYFLLVLLVPRFLATGPMVEDLNNSLIYQGAKNSSLISNFKNKFLSSIMHPIVVSREDQREMKINFEIKNQKIDNAACDQILTQINLARQEKGLSALTRDAKLNQFAQNYAFEIIKTKRFSHYSVDNLSPEDRAIKENINFTYLGENLAVAPTAIEAHTSLMASPEHRENIEMPLFKKIGISCIDLGVGEKLFVEEYSN